MDDASISDERLLARSAEGDGGAFDSLVRRHEDRVFSICLRITRDRADAFDATQETFVTVLRKGHTFSGRSAFTTWLYRVAVNASNDLLRKRARHPLLDDATRPDSEAASHDPPLGDQVDMRVDLRNALQVLSDEYREAVLLHDLAGVPYEDIATMTGVAIGTVKSRISRGRRRLAEILEQGTVAGPSKEQ